MAEVHLEGIPALARGVSLVQFEVESTAETGLHGLPVGIEDGLKTRGAKHPFHLFPASTAWTVEDAHILRTPALVNRVFDEHAPLDLKLLGFYRIDQRRHRLTKHRKTRLDSRAVGVGSGDGIGVGNDVGISDGNSLGDSRGRRQKQDQ